MDTFLRASQPGLFERRAQRWDRWVTGCIVFLLFVPLPFARIEAWPHGTVVTERVVMPWSQFRVCYTDPDGNGSVEEGYRFNWKGRLVPVSTRMPLLVVDGLASPPIFKWQSSPDIVLQEMFQKGSFLKVKTSWIPPLIWPFKMGWQAIRNS